LAEAEGADGFGDFAHVDGVETPKPSLCRPKLAQRHIRDRQERQQIVCGASPASPRLWPFS
jgi:hypothetical protein